MVTLLNFFIKINAFLFENNIKTIKKIIKLASVCINNKNLTVTEKNRNKVSKN